MDIRGETIQNGEPSPEHPVEIENKTNILLAIEILKKLKSKVTLVKVDDENNSEKEYRLPFLMNIEQQAIETVLSELEKKDKIIDSMAEFINKFDLDESICKDIKCNNDVTKQDCINCIKKYFFDTKKNIF